MFARTASSRIGISRPANAQASATQAPPPPEDDAIATRLLAGSRLPMPTKAAAISTISSRSLLSITPYFLKSARYSASLPFAAVCAAIARVHRGAESRTQRGRRVGETLAVRPAHRHVVFCGDRLHLLLQRQPGFALLLGET